MERAQTEEPVGLTAGLTVYKLCGPGQVTEPFLSLWSFHCDSWSKIQGFCGDWKIRLGPSRSQQVLRKWEPILNHSTNNSDSYHSPSISWNHYCHLKVTQFSSIGPRELLVNNQHGDRLSVKNSIFSVSFKVALLITFSGGPLLPETFAKHPKRCMWQKAMQTSQREPAGLWAVLVLPRPKLLRFDPDLASCGLTLFHEAKSNVVSVESGARHPGLNPGSTYLNTRPSAKLLNHLKPQCSYSENGERK